jgi:hypothetical protein
MHFRRKMWSFAHMWYVKTHTACFEQVRRQAEHVIEQHLNSNREVIVLGLISLLRVSNDGSVRALCAIILRRRLPVGEPVVFEKLSEQLQHMIKTDLLASIANEPERYVRSQVCDTVTAMAEVLLYKNGWEELMPFLYSCSQADSGQRHSALTIFGKLCELCPPETVLTPHIKHIHGLYASALSEPNEAMCALAVTNICTAVINFDQNVKAQHMPPFQQLIPGILKVLCNVLEAHNEKVVLEILSALADVGTDEPTFFRPHLDEVAKVLAGIGNNAGLQDGMRQLAMEILVLIAEEAPGMVRKSHIFTVAILQLFFHSAVHRVCVCARVGVCNESRRVRK